MSSGKTYRTRAQSIGIVVVSVLLTLAFLFVFVPDAARRRTPNIGDLWVMSVLALLLYSFFVLRVARAGIQVSGEEIKIRNPIALMLSRWRT